MVKVLITTIQVNFCAASQNLPELSLLKFLPLTYHHSHFLAATLDFTSFFTIAFLRAAHFFYSLAVLDYIPLNLVNVENDSSTRQSTIECDSKWDRWALIRIAVH